MSLAELQADPDTWLETDNTAWPRQAYRTKGRPPLQAFGEGLAAQSGVAARAA